MDTNDKDKSDSEKRNDEPLSYHSLGVPSDWRYNIPNFASSSIGLVSSGDGVGPSSSSASMVDSMGPAVWESPINTSHLSFNELNPHNDPRVSDPLSILKGGLFLPNMMSMMLPHNLSQIPTDSAFIERAARFSSFSGGHFGDLLNSMGMNQSCGPFGQGGIIMQGPQAMMGRHTQKTCSADAPKDVSLGPGHGAIDGNSPKNETTVERSRDEAKQAVMSGNDSDEPECSGGFAKDIGAKKRKRGNQDVEAEQTNANEQQSSEAKKNDSDIQQKGAQNSTPTSNKSNGKQVKQNSQTSDSPKEEYIHVRARRGQATNSHSLAERVRREKISERMKFLQDLVPGCSKVTGKAVMLDEIINYVQSLQRQVEFLSMKLAAVNPQLDFNIDRLLTKDVFSARAGPSLGPTFSPDIPMPYHPLHPGQSPMLPPVLPGAGNPNDTLRRVIGSQLPNMGGGYKEPSSQLPNAWDGELRNIVHMGFNANAPIDNQDGNGSVPQDQTNADS